MKFISLPHFKFLLNYIFGG